MAVISEIGKGDRTIIMRIGPGEDLIEGIEAGCKKHGVKYGVITACYGSLKRIYLNYYYPPKDLNDPFGKDRDLALEQSFSFLSAQGMICEESSGEINIHIHGVVRGEDGEIYGSHIPKGGNIVKNTMDVAVTVISDIKMMRLWDEETKHLQTTPVREEKN